MFDVITGAPLYGTRLDAMVTFMAERGLTYEGGADFSVLIYDGDELTACGSLAGSVIKYLATAESAEGTGVMSTVLTELMKHAFALGLKPLFIFTKPQNGSMFRSMGFYEIASTRQAMLMESARNGISDWLASLERGAGGVTGAIVMNANPFTNGHKRLCEHASSLCDCLHIFVVSEENPHFTADERFMMVKRGVSHIENAIVHPGGAYTVSRATFPTYFVKERGMTENVQCDLDIAIFGERIAPALGITKRFVGSEPFCPVTDAYNTRMAQLLPKYGVSLDVLERTDGISASEVRRLIDKGDYDSIRPIVPETTYEVLLGKRI